MVGRIFRGRYEAVRLLGEGGMGRVYLARDLELNRQVVVKVMHDHIAADPTFRERFERETKLMTRLSHPYVVTLFDASVRDPVGLNRESSSPCIVMEYVKGVNLDTLLARNGRFSPPRVGRLLGQLCEALQAAHDLDIIHRDLKPANIMVIDADTPREKIKVMDFGLAKQPGEMNKVTDTNVDFAVGTPGYMAPEQVRGEEIDYRSDLYSVGVIIYELLTGRLPFTGATSMDIMLAHATEAPPTFEQLGLADVIPESIEQVVMDCLAKHPEERPQSARELAERYEAALAYEQALAEGIQAVPPFERNAARAAPIPAPATPQMPSALAAPIDPNTITFQMEAWMPESIAVMKMRGFVHDLGGDVIESVPGLIRVRLNLRGRSSALAWLGFGRRDLLDLELRMIQIDPSRENRLSITVVFRPPYKSLLNNATYRERCTQVFIELRAYLMGRTGEG
jgi:serine/threonine protein kinase